MSFPRLSSASRGLRIPVTFVETPTLLASGGKTTHLTVLVYRVDDPVDTCVTANGFVLGVDKDHFEVFVGTVLVDPVAVEDAQIGAASADALFRGRLERTLVFQLVNTLVGRLACQES